MKPLEWLKAHVDYSGDDCLIWPFSRTIHGYGQIKMSGRVWGAHRAILALATGIEPAGKEAAHSCGNGHLGCANVRHLSWKTKKENASDRLVHGTSNRGEAHPRAKLTEEAVLMIYGARGTLRQIGSDFGIGAAAVHRIKNGFGWGWLTGHTAALGSPSK